MITDLAQVTEGRLCWPHTKPRSAQRVDGPFRGRNVDVEQREITYEMQRWNVRDWILSRNRDRIFAGDPGAALWWVKSGEIRVLACDKYVKMADNLHAIYLTLDAMRALERWGAYTAEQASEGARLALPGPATPAAKPWWLVIPEIKREWPLAAIEGMYRDAMKRSNEARQIELNAAIEAARMEKRS